MNNLDTEVDALVNQLAAQARAWCAKNTVPEQPVAELVETLVADTLAWCAEHLPSE